MAKTNRSKWSKYKVGEPSTRSNWTNPDCCQLDTVHHICHVSDAYRMLEDGKIRSSLIWDESCLNNTRTCVAWLSPNHWSNGSLYGNIEFHFDWRRLVEDRKFFWVEAIEKYNPPAFRILITDKDSFFDLEPYPVEESGGPLFFDKETDIWYWNSELTGEFMIDQDISLRDCTGVGFCQHHPSICRKDGRSCSDLDQRWDKAGTKLLGRAIGTNVVKSSSENQRLFMKDGKLESLTERCIVDILYRSAKCSFTGEIKSGDDAALPLASTILERIGRDRKIGSLASLFKTTEDFEMSLRKRMAKAFDMPLSEFPSTEDE